MLTENDINNFFISKKDIEVRIDKYVLSFKIPNGIYEHFCNSPASLDALDLLYNKNKADLQKMEDDYAKSRNETESLNKGIIIKEKRCGNCGGNTEQDKQKIKEINNKTWGLGNLAKAIASGVVSEEIKNIRFEKCSKCEIKDIEGNRLFREENGVNYCGVPRLAELAKIKRDERHWGCGCELHEKIKYNSSECPFKVW